MIRHASSHGFAVFMCTIISAFLVDILSRYLPDILRRVDELSIALIARFNIPMSIEYLSVAIVASVLAMLWGIFFKMYKTKKGYDDK